VTAKIAENLDAPKVILNFSTKLDLLADSSIDAAQSINLTSPDIIQKGRLEASDIFINSTSFNNYNFIEAKNLLDITAQNEAHNYPRSYLKSKGNIEIKAAILNNKNVISACGKLTIDENNHVINSGKLVSQGDVDRQNISPIASISPDIYLKIVTQKLVNTGRIFAGNIDIDTRKGLHDESLQEADFSNKLGQIEALNELKLAGTHFHNATLLEASKVTLQYQKIKTQI
jgi:hypothetical protein